jgi:hypothetical protein
MHQALRWSCGKEVIKSPIQSILIRTKFKDDKCVECASATGETQGQTHSKTLRNGVSETFKTLISIFTSASKLCGVLRYINSTDTVYLSKNSAKSCNDMVNILIYLSKNSAKSTQPYVPATSPSPPRHAVRIMAALIQYWERTAGTSGKTSFTSFNG